MHPDEAAEDAPALDGLHIEFDVVDVDAAGDLAAYEAVEAQGRSWLRSIVGLLRATSLEPDPNPRVQFALDRMRIAACERAARLLSSDVADASG